MALLRQGLVGGYLRKEIEQYGVLKVTPKGEDFLRSSEGFLMTEDHNYDALEQEYTAVNRKSGVTDEVLLSALRDLRRSEAKRLGIPPFALFQDASLEDMALRYPITLEEMKTIFGVGEGKARKYGQKFADFIAKYVEQNDIVRPDDLVAVSYTHLTLPTTLSV